MNRPTLEQLLGEADEGLAERLAGWEATFDLWEIAQKECGEADFLALNAFRAIRYMGDTLEILRRGLLAEQARLEGTAADGAPPSEVPRSTERSTKRGAKRKGAA